MKPFLLTVPFGLALAGCGSDAGAGDPAPGFDRVQRKIDARDKSNATPTLRLALRAPDRKDRVVHPEAEWRQILGPERYAILREGGTEKPFTSPLLKEHEKGVFLCEGCGNRVFRSDAKFDSGTGWPSFVRPATTDAVWYRSDAADGIARTEVRCAKCDGHLGHAFADGPIDRGGLRYCIDGAALVFKRGG